MEHLLFFTFCKTYRIKKKDVNIFIDLLLIAYVEILIFCIFIYTLLVLLSITNQKKVIDTTSWILLKRKARDLRPFHE